MTATQWRHEGTHRHRYRDGISREPALKDYAGGLDAIAGADDTADSAGNGCLAAGSLAPLHIRTWNSYQNIWSLTDERLVRSLDVQREQATKAFEIIDLTLNNAMELIAGMSSEDIRREEPRLYPQFKKFSDTIPVVQSLWVYDRDGHAAVSSRAHPPPTQSFSDRDFYLAHVKENIGTYYGKV